MAGYRPVKLVQVKDTFQIGSGEKIFADYLDYSFGNSAGSIVTLKGKFTQGVSSGDEVLLIVTNNSKYQNSQAEPTAEDLKTDWFVIDRLIAVGNPPEVSYTIQEKEYSFLCFAFYKQLNPTLTKTGEIPVV